MNTSIKLENVGQKYDSQWIFKNLSYTFEKEQSYAIIGNNGSGKSTLMSVLSGFQTPTKGKITFYDDLKIVENDHIFKHVSIAAPYISLIEDYNLEEMINFHFSFVKMIDKENVESLIYYTYLEKNKNKLIRNFSSGMKQRLKLGLVAFSDKPIILLDEPTVNLDTQATDWYLTKILPKLSNKISIICSNQINEYQHCNHILNINDFKN